LQKLLTNLDALREKAMNRASGLGTSPRRDGRHLSAIYKPPGNFQFVIVAQGAGMVPILSHRLLMIGRDSIVPPVTLDAMDAITRADRGGTGDGNKTGSRAE